jgi:hypothetical protein
LHWKKKNWQSNSKGKKRYTGLSVSNKKSSFWKKVGIAIAVVGFIVASFALNGLLRLLSEVPIIGIVAKWLLHFRETG